MAKKTKQPKTTVQKLKYWQRWQKGILAGEFAMPVIPFGVILGINWDNWVGGSPSSGWSIGLGFGMLIVATIVAIAGIWKKDELVNSKMSGIFYVAVWMVIVGFGFKLIATVFNTFGDMFIYVALSVGGSGVLAQVNKSKVRVEIERYKKLVKENGLDKKSAREIEDAEQAKREGEEARKERVDLL